jgi:outer membrane biosynthesis protein TonB
LDGSGSAQSVRVVRASPPGVFDAAVLKAVSEIRFKLEVKREHCGAIFQFSVP